MTERAKEAPEHPIVLDVLNGRRMNSPSPLPGREHRSEGEKRPPWDDDHLYPKAALIGVPHKRTRHGRTEVFYWGIVDASGYVLRRYRPLMPGHHGRVSADDWRAEEPAFQDMNG